MRTKRQTHVSSCSLFRTKPHFSSPNSASRTSGRIIERTFLYFLWQTNRTWFGIARYQQMVSYFRLLFELLALRGDTLYIKNWNLQVFVFIKCKSTPEFFKLTIFKKFQIVYFPFRSHTSSWYSQLPVFRNFSYDEVQFGRTV